MKKNYNISPGIRKVIVNQSYDTAKPLTDKDKLIFRDILQEAGYCNRKPTKDLLTGAIDILNTILIMMSKKF